MSKTIKNRPEPTLTTVARWTKKTAKLSQERRSERKNERVLIERMLRGLA